MEPTRRFESLRNLRFIPALALLVLAMPASAGKLTQAPAPAVASRIQATTLVKGLEHPWSFRFLPDGRIVVTEKGGRMRLADRNGQVSGVPAVVAVEQGGLLDVALAPDFATSGQIYFTYSEPRGGRNSGTSVARAKLELEGGGGRLTALQVIFRQKPDNPVPIHFGSRIAFAADGSLFVTLGERGTGRTLETATREMAQNPANHFGKVVRINPDGSPHASTPKRPGWAPEVWSLGHRNPQSAAIHPVTGKLWTVEHGARGGDEVNIPEAGKNCGWPVISCGRDYSGTKIGVGTEKAGLEQPVYYWDPSIAPSGMAFYTGNLFPAWKGNLFVGALNGVQLVRLVLDGEQVVAEEKLLNKDYDRFRDVREGPDGALYVMTDSPNARIIRITPAP